LLPRVLLLLKFENPCFALRLAYFAFGFPPAAWGTTLGRRFRCEESPLTPDVGLNAKACRDSSRELQVANALLMGIDGIPEFNLDGESSLKMSLLRRSL
jgi:hypothetical protein